MLERPAFKPHFRLQTVEGEGIFLLSETAHSVIRGRLYESIIPSIDGRRSTEEIVHQVRDHVSPAEVYYALAQLEKKGYLGESHPGVAAGQAALWATQEIDAQKAAQRLAETTVSLAALGQVELEPFVRTLQTLNVRVGEGGRLGVVLVDDYLHSGLHAMNKEALQSGRPWLIIKPVGCQIWLGPLFVPGKTGCWACLAHRLRGSRQVESFVQEKNGHPDPVPLALSFTQATLQVAWNMAASAVADWVASEILPYLEGQLLTLDVGSWQTQSHAMVRRPQCPACGDPSASAPSPGRPVVLESRRKTFLEDGGHRTVAPEETLHRYEHHISPITGAVTELYRSVAVNGGAFHVYYGGPNVAMRQDDLRGLRWGLRMQCAGKGASDVQARTSGLCEALERYSGIFGGDEPICRARFTDLGEAAIHPNACMRFSDLQYRQRDDWNARRSRYNFVPLPFDEQAEIDWTAVWSLTAQRFRYLPTRFCYFKSCASTEPVYCVGCSNGNAAGNTLEEAILQGFLELVERDSVALWWYNRVRRPAVAVESFEEPYLHKLSACLRERRRELWVLDLTADLSVPVFVALSRRIDQQPESIMLGYGAHLDARIALLRAVTEMNQMLSWIMDETGEQIPRAPAHSETVNWLETATLANQPYLAPDESTAPRVRSDYPRLWSEDLREDVQFCQALVERQGLEMLVLDQTRPDIGLPVAKVIVPGLRHFWARYAPGRIYDVPVRLGWLPQALSEDQLNPIPMFT